MSSLWKIFVFSTLILGVKIFLTLVFPKTVKYYQESRIALFLIVAIYEYVFTESKPPKLIISYPCFNFF